MTLAGSLLLSHEWGVYGNNGYNSQHKRVIGKGNFHLFSIPLSSHALRQEAWSHSVFNGVHRAKSSQSSRCNVFQCRSFLVPGGGNAIPVLKTAAAALTKSYNSLYGSPGVLKLVPAVGIIAFAAWGLGPLMRLIRVLFLREPDNSWKKSSTHYVMTSYLQPLLLWTGAMLICRVLDPIILPTEASQAIKQRLLNFIQSLSTVLAFAYCLSSLIQQVQKFFMETNEPNDARNMGFQFAGKAVYTAVWVAAVSLFMELLGFSTQKWVTAGGLGTVLLTLAGREIFTNFLSSVMIHATRPFITNEWIQTKIEGYEVSGTVEHVGWWSPTIIRGDDREAIHIPNHKFTMNVVRNLSQKTHWRIKTYLAISHLDANKINNIVADMRKVLGKHPQVEQQRLHRRVFLENIDPENQALMILVSCFVKTSGFEEYLRVKEAILLDLLRVISHHRARLATPIRTVQKIYDDDNLPFADTIFTGSRPASNRNRPLLLPSTPNAASVAPVEDTEDQQLNKNALDGAKKVNSRESGGEKTDISSTNSNGKLEVERPRTSLEDNIVLGVALEGSKRTLPIEEDETTAAVTSAESKELAASRNRAGPASVGMEKKDDQIASVPATGQSDQREKER